MEQEDFEGLAFIMISENRIRIIKSLKNKPKMPTQIETELKITHISRYLIELKKKGLVEVLNESAKKGRFYALTKDGESCLNAIETLEKLK